MSERRLPRFTLPPVVEVAIGIIFSSPTLSVPQQWTLFSRLRERFPVFSTAFPLASPIEFLSRDHVSAVPQLALTPNFRSQFVSADTTSTIQIQNDRLIVNWKVGNAKEPYPSFEAVESQFADVYAALVQIADEAPGLQLSIRFCEVAYVNHIPATDGAGGKIEPRTIFRNWQSDDGELSNSFHDLSFNARYLVPRESASALCNLTVTLSTSYPTTGALYELTMYAFGVPASQDLAGIRDFHRFGHDVIVKQFASMTTDEMHSKWGRYQ